MIFILIGDCSFTGTVILLLGLHIISRISQEQPEIVNKLIVTNVAQVQSSTTIVVLSHAPANNALSSAALECIQEQDRIMIYILQDLAMYIFYVWANRLSGSTSVCSYRYYLVSNV